MMAGLIDVERLRKDHVALRPVRIEKLRIQPGERAAILGVDAAAAEALIGLLTGAMLPDEGTVRIRGRDTASITTAEDWTAALEGFGVISTRAVLIGEMTVAQNLALAYTLSVDPIPDAVMADVRRLSVEAGVPLDRLDARLDDVAADVQARCHLARALAQDPFVLLLDHANALTDPGDAPAFGRDIARVAGSRRVAVLAFTADEAFAHAAADRIYVMESATGRLVSRSGWRRWFT